MIKTKTIIAILMAFFFLAANSAVWGEEEAEEEKRELTIPLKTKYAPQEREVILGFDIAHSGQAETWITSLEVEYSIYDRIEFDLELPVVARFTDDEGNHFGIGDIETGVKVKLYESDDESFHFAGGLEATWPTGKVSTEIGEGKGEVGPFVAVAKGLGNFSLLGAFGYERVVTTRGDEANEGDKNGFNLDAAIAYTFPFGLSPLFEVNSSFETENIVLLTPGLIYAITDRFQTRGGFQVPVTSDKEFSWNAIFQLLYDFK